MADHISVRLYWHDSGWNGRVCRSPAENVWCEAHEQIRDHKDVSAEVANAGCTFTDSTTKPPCEASTQAFSPVANEILTYPPQWLIDQQVKPVPRKFPPVTATAWPFEHMWAEDQSHKDNVERRRIAEEFLEAVKPKESLVFFYVDERNPLFIDNGERSPARVLVGVSRVSAVGEIREYNDADWRGEHNMIWSVPLSHGWPEDGVRLPVHEVMTALPEAEDRLRYLAPLDGGLRTDFRYGSHVLAIDRAVTALERAISALVAVEADEVLDGDYSQQIRWLSDRLLEVWKERGPYPGLGPLLAFLGAPRAARIQSDLVQALADQGIDPGSAIFDALNGSVSDLFKDYEDDFTEARDEWEYLSEEERDLTRILARIALTREQVDHILNESERVRHGLPADPVELQDNPYRLVEDYVPNKGGEPIHFNTVDHALVPHEVMGRVEGDRFSRNDPRRLRALMIGALTDEADAGNTFADVSGILQRVSDRSPEDRRCDVPIARLKHEKIEPVLLERLDLFEDEGVRYVGLKRLRADEEAVAAVLDELTARKDIEAGRPLDWQSLADKTSAEDHQEGVELSSEQREALDRCFRSPFSVITGAAGTGKSTLLAPLVEGIREQEGQVDVLALTPTGKAADRLRELNVDAITIHRKLAQAGWYDWDLGVHRENEGRVRANTLIIDECSMVTIELFATLLRSIDWDHVSRLILVGDHHQLPPIGPGRPFFDVISRCRSADDDEPSPYSDRLSALTFNYRVAEGSHAIALANSFTSLPEPDQPLIWSSLARGEDLGDLRVRYWDTGEELHELLLAEITEILSLVKETQDRGVRDYDLFNVSVGSKGDLGAAFWQIITPVRGEMHGSRKLNAVIQDRYHGGLKRGSRKMHGIRFGNEHVTLFDKVMQVENEQRWSWKKRDRFPVFNGQLGAVIGTYPFTPPGQKGKRPQAVNVRFDGAPDTPFAYRKGDVDASLQLAYGMTVHKSQGSQFRHVLFVVPESAGTLLTRELAYTGLTRAQTSLTLFIQGSADSLLPLRRLGSAETPRRNSRLFSVTAGGLTKYRAEGLIHVTARGERVRSKSEVIVANRLAEHDLTYEYEAELRPPENEQIDMRLPDFTVHHRGRTFYWEHCGRVNDAAYMTRWQEVRLPWYKKHGFAERLIVTYDEVDGGIDTTKIDVEIEKILAR